MSAPWGWDALSEEADKLVACAQAGDWPRVAQVHESLSESLRVITKADGMDAAQAAARVATALHEAARLTEAARDAVAKQLLELRAGSRAVAAYSVDETVTHRRR